MFWPRWRTHRDDRLLLVRETADEHRWTLPGGWADVNESRAEDDAREVRAETGLQVRSYKLAAVWDRVRHPHGVVQPFQIGGFSSCARSSAVSPKLAPRPAKWSSPQMGISGQLSIVTWSRSVKDADRRAIWQ